MKNVTKVLCLLTALGMLAAMLAGCGTSAPAASAPASATTVATQAAAATAAPAETTVELKKVPLVVMVAGDRPKQQDEVLANIDKVTQGELNIDLQLNYFPWQDFANTVSLKASAGEEFDIYLNFYSELAGSISRKQCVALNDLLDKYGPDLKSQIPQYLWDSLTVGGKIYGVPSVYAMTEMGRGFLVRKDLRVKYNLPEITDMATLEQYLDAIAKNEPGVIPWLGGTLGTAVICDKSNVGHSVFTFGSDAAKFMYVNQDVRPLKVENYIKTDIFKKVWQENVKAYANGWFEKDFLSDNDRDGKFIAGKAAAMAGDLYNITDRQNALQKNVPTGELELAVINKDGKWVNTDPVNNYAQIYSLSKNPERAMMFLNWLRKDQKNYDLYMLGIEGVTYNLVGEKAEVPAGVNAADRFNPTPWFTMHFPYLRTWTSDPQSYVDALAFWNTLKPEAAPLSTFAYSGDNVKAEQAAVIKVWTEEEKPLELGMLSTQADYDKLVADLEQAGIQKIIDDTQKQIDAFVAANNIK